MRMFARQQTASVHSKKGSSCLDNSHTHPWVVLELSVVMLEYPDDGYAYFDEGSTYPECVSEYPDDGLKYNDEASANP